MIYLFIQFIVHGTKWLRLKQSYEWKYLIWHAKVIMWPARTITVVFYSKFNWPCDSRSQVWTEDEIQDRYGLDRYGIEMWACLVEGFNTLVTTGGLNCLDKRVAPDCWLRSGFKSQWRQLVFKPLSRSHQLRTLHCRATQIWASFLRANDILPFSI